MLVSPGTVAIRVVGKPAHTAVGVAVSDKVFKYMRSTVTVLVPLQPKLSLVTSYTCGKMVLVVVACVKLMVGTGVEGKATNEYVVPTPPPLAVSVNVVFGQTDAEDAVKVKLVAKLSKPTDTVELPVQPALSTCTV